MRNIAPIKGGEKICMLIYWQKLQEKGGIKSISKNAKGGDMQH